MYNSLVVIVFITYFSLNAFAESETEDRDIRFTPHITSEAWTNPQWSVSLQRSVGSNLNTDFLLSSLNLSVTDRLEIGTSPLFYFTNTHIFNLSAKYNFWRAKKFLWSVGLNTASFNLEDDGGEQLESKLNLLSFQILLNYLPNWTRLKFGANLNYVEASLTDFESGNDDELLLDGQWEFGVDISSPFNKNKEITLGLGWLRESGISALEEVEFGFGLSFRIYRPKKFISSPTLGLHYGIDSENTSFLISTTFY